MRSRSKASARAVSAGTLGCAQCGVDARRSAALKSPASISATICGGAVRRIASEGGAGRPTRSGQCDGQRAAFPCAHRAERKEDIRLVTDHVQAHTTPAVGAAERCVTRQS